MQMVVRPWGGEPRHWVLCFVRSSPVRWARWLSFGRYKHVRAFGYVKEADAWIFYDVGFPKTHVYIACDDAAKRMREVFCDDADMLGMPSMPGNGGGFRFGMWCVPAIKHLVGLQSSALRPNALWRDCIANGGEVISVAHLQDA